MMQIIPFCDRCHKFLEPDGTYGLQLYSKSGAHIPEVFDLCGGCVNMLEFFIHGNFKEEPAIA